MKKTLTLGALGVALVILAMVRANAAAPTTPATKVGYIDLQRTLNETKAGRAARDRLEGEKKKKQKEIDEKQAEIKKGAEELEKQRVVLKQDVLRQREKELQERYVALQNTFMQHQQDLAKREAQLTREIFEKASKIIESIAKRDGFTMILEKTEGAVLYADSSMDITPEVNKRLDSGEGGK
ncbi:MAG: OmpH family outer membrane protein [Deltaproteobacteria bacterium]|nr:OmpH family outer membrane protein [Deltaproteobacteria bacterium]